MRSFNPQASTSNPDAAAGVPTRGSWKLKRENHLVNVLLFFSFTCLGGGLVNRLFADESSGLSSVTASNVIPATAATAAAPAAPAVPVTRQFSESDLLELLTATLQKEYVKDKGDLELRLTRPWAPRTVPDEPLTIKLLDMPANGVTPAFILRFELCTATQVLGSWQSSVQARVWRDVWVARSAVKRGELVADADLDRQRRDVLTMRESLADFAAGDPALELAEPLQSGAPLLARSIRVRPVIRRGQAADALVQDGPLSITMRVEALEDGAPGQTIRARNPQTRRDIRGKVLNEQTILLAL